MVATYQSIYLHPRPLFLLFACMLSFSVMSSCFVTPWIIAHPAPLSMELSRQECFSGLSFPTPGVLPNPGIKPVSPALADGSEPLEKPLLTL